MQLPFRDGDDARLTMLMEENEALTAEVEALRARVPLNQDAFVQRLEGQRDEAVAELKRLQREPLEQAPLSETEAPAFPPVVTRVVVPTVAFLWGLLAMLGGVR